MSIPELAKLKELEADMPPAPWSWAEFTENQRHGDTCYTHYVESGSEGDPEEEVCAFGLGSRQYNADDDPKWEQLAASARKAEFVATMRNQMKALLALAESAVEECRAWRANYTGTAHNEYLVKQTDTALANLRAGTGDGHG